MRAIKNSLSSKSLVKRSNLCVCWTCFETYKASEVTHWCLGDSLAFCPKCQVGTVVADAGGALPDSWILLAWHNETFLNLGDEFSI
jgi:hypothetical protein